jgi:hypothetical protein
MRTIAQNRAAKKYIDSHREMYRAIVRKSCAKFYEKNADIVKINRMRRYYYQIEFKRLANMFDCM